MAKLGVAVQCFYNGEAMALVGVRLTAQLGDGFWALMLRFIVEFKMLESRLGREEECPCLSLGPGAGIFTTNYLSARIRSSTFADPPQRIRLAHEHSHGHR
ncbi:hypothetical protein [Synechocystis sp. LKSZ1]|uniref:hypothetical protein n=1 Tax=Synechocystis sp. LKSZ1 TaxID=3144951 RepID=UPI00336C1399